MLQFAPAARLVPQLFRNANADAFVPVTAMLLILTAPAPVLVSVTDCDALVAPTGTLPKDKLVAESDTVALLVALLIPVPVNAMD
jgi:hypothetical protein